MRRSEIVGLRWCDIDFKNKVIYVKHAKVTIREKFKEFYKEKHGEITAEGHLLKKPKNKTSYREIPMSETLYNVLWQWYIEQKGLRIKAKDKAVYNDFVCTMREDGREMKPDYITQAFHNLLVKYNLPLIRFHDLRGTLASLLIESDENIKYVSELLGHYDSRTTERYYAKTVKARMQKVGSKIDEVIK